MAKYEGATWKPIPANFNKGRRQSPTKGLILHITDGALNKKTGIKTPPSLEGLYSTFKQQEPQRLGPFRGEQRRRDVAIHRYRQPRLVGRWRHDRRALVSIENIAVPGDTLSEDQIMACAGLLYWLNQTYDCPIKMAVGKSDSGVAYHSLFQRGHRIVRIPVISLIPRICASACWDSDRGTTGEPVTSLRGPSRRVARKGALPHVTTRTNRRLERISNGSRSIRHNRCKRPSMAPGDDHDDLRPWRSQGDSNPCFRRERATS